MAASDKATFDRSLSAFLADERESLVNWRRTLHRYPEVGWTEYRTTYLIGEELRALGFELSIGKEASESSERMGVLDSETLSRHERRAREAGVPEQWMREMEGGNTGLVARWDTGREGPHFAFRFDIDALEIRESDAQTHIPAVQGFRSTQEGVMHACGHDGHATIGIGVARFIMRYGETLHGRFTLIFQPAEEGGRGAKAMVEKGWLDDVNYFLSGHIGIRSLDLGEVVATTSGFFCTTKIDVAFRGRSAHAGGEPHRGRNALLAGASAALHLHGIPRHGEGATRINVGRLVAGTGRNVVPDRAMLELETRGETEELNRYMVGEAERIIRATARLYDVEEDIEIVGEATDATCDEEWASLVERACAPSQAITRVLPHADFGVSEDATFMINRVQQRGGKATYLLFGSPIVEGHHHPRFDYNEEVLVIAVETLSRLVQHCQHEARRAGTREM
jgi:aminobenzoyl-glutamate utilization protein A